MYALYTLLYVTALCALAPRTLWDLVRGGKYAHGLGQRLGLDPVATEELRGAVWIHAVSVGEVHAARGLMPHLRRRFPGRPVVMSTTTTTGQRLARQTEADATFYCPLDLPWTVGSVLDRLQPEALILIETEIWPNTLRACDRRDVPVALVNARLSRRSSDRYRRLGGLWRRVLGRLAVVCARTEREAGRYRDLGCPPERVFVTGNLKGDAAALQPPEAHRRAVARALRVNGSRPLWVAGCTMPGEEEAILEAFTRVRRRHPRTRLLLAPRHPERFDRVAAKIVEAGWSLRRRSVGGPDDAEVLLLDTIGELPAAYGLGTVSFVGGSLVPSGGHNLLEPAVQARPVVFGPHMYNFSDLAASFRRSGGGWCVRSPDELATAIQELLDDPERRHRMGDVARTVALRDAVTGRRTARVLAASLRPR